MKAPDDYESSESPEEIRERLIHNLNTALVYSVERYRKHEDKTGFEEEIIMQLCTLTVVLTIIGTILLPEQPMSRLN
jgi:hypothetical protein